MKQAEANDAASICLLAGNYHRGVRGFQQDQTKAVELYTRAAYLGSSRALSHLGNIYHQEGDMKKAKFHFEAAAIWQDTKWQETTLDAWTLSVL
jgi:TPR repeat protein